MEEESGSGSGSGSVNGSVNGSVSVKEGGGFRRIEKERRGK